jgi:diguanylate cyclase (GGDEF)-like protein/PAS domain S-box-containing protein
VTTTPGPRAPVQVGDLLAELTDRRRQLRTVIDHLPALIAYWDQDLRNVLANRAYVQWFDWSPNQMQGHHLSEVIGPDLFALNEPYVRKALAGEEQRFDRSLVDPSGRTRFAQVAYVPDKDEAGHVHGFFVLVTDLADRIAAEQELRAAKEALEQRTLLDPLTHLANREALEQAGTRALSLLARAEPGSRHLALLVIDLDRFKPINDGHGHAAGDEVLVELAQRLSRELRSPDLAVRIGGDEMVVLATEIDDNPGAEHLAKRLVNRLGKPVLLSSGRSVTVTASIGIAIAGDDRPLPTLHDLLRQADAKMYEAKRAGGHTYR